MISTGALFGAMAMGSAMQGANMFGNSLYSNYAARKNEKKSLKRQYKYARLYALNSPSWTVEGLRTANLNPILAATDGAFSSPTVPNVSSTVPSSGSAPSWDFGSAYLQGKQLQSQIGLQDSQANLNTVKALNELKNWGFTGSAAVGARIFNELFNGHVDVDNPKQFKPFENLWNGVFGSSDSSAAKPVNSVPLGMHNASDVPNSSHDIKTRHHPSDDVFKPNWSGTSSVARFFNDVDRHVHLERLSRKHFRDNSDSVESAEYRKAWNKANPRPKRKYNNFSFLYR